MVCPGPGFSMFRTAHNRAASLLSHSLRTVSGMWEYFRPRVRVGSRTCWMQDLARVGVRIAGVILARMRFKVLVIFARWTDHSRFIFIHSPRYLTASLGSEALMVERLPFGWWWGREKLAGSASPLSKTPTILVGFGVYI